MDAEIKAQLDRIEKLTLLAAKNVLSIDDLSLLIGRSTKTIRNQIKDIPHYKDGRTVWFKRSEIEEWQCKVKHETIML